MTDALPQQDGAFGFQALASDTDEFNQMHFFVSTMIAALNIATLVQVKAVHTSSRTGPAGTVDVVPLVNQITGSGQAVPHTTVYGLPFFRLQGGVGGVICDPQPGDIGLAVICDRDISGVKKGLAATTPGSYRRFSYADGFYLGGWNAGAAPTKAVILDSSGCEITCPTKIDGDTNLNGGVLKINGTQVVQGRLAAVVPPTGGATIDVQARAAVNDLINRFQTHGLTS